MDAQYAHRRRADRQQHRPGEPQRIAGELRVPCEARRDERDGDRRGDTSYYCRPGIEQRREEAEPGERAFL